MVFSIFRPIRIMLSSRCSDLVEGADGPQEMQDLREQVKSEIEGLKLAKHQVFEVWIHEPESAGEASEDSWQNCMRAVRDADVVIVLYNGRAGWPGPGTSGAEKIGICHAELAEAYNSAPSKLRIVQLPLVRASKGSLDERFQVYLAAQGLSAAQVDTAAGALAACRDAAVAALLALGRAGVGVGKRGRYHSGQALSWSRLDFAERRRAMSAVVRTAIGGRETGDQGVEVRFPGAIVAFVCDAVPAPMSTAAARELVGQPFLEDHATAACFERGVVGPVHLIACHRGVTENQALKQLGFPDALVVQGPFGVYVADDVQKIQMVFLANCRDETSTYLAVQEFTKWLESSGEQELFVGRARSRGKICKAIAKEQSE